MFHPAVQHWFEASFDAPTPVQVAAWKAIRADRNVLIAAPTGSGKTFAAFLCAIDDLVRRAQHEPLPDAVQVLYVSPLKALSNDIEKNLQAPLAGIDDWLQGAHGRDSGIRAAVRTGDTTPGEREQMRRRPPQLLVTTPESLYLLLTSASGRAMLSGVREVIVDEIHAVAGSKRGSHLTLSLARLDALLPAPARRIGLSATQKPIETIAEFLTGGQPCTIVDTGHQRERDLQLELPGSPLTPVMANEVWEEIYNRLEGLIADHRTTLIFVNTRRLAERLARHLAERLGEDAVTAHHGSLSRRHRLAAEQALKNGRLRALVATASLELGIDIGHVDLVCQIGSPGSISALIQRVGRAGHAVHATPKGRLFPCTRDDLVEAIALLRAIRDGQLDRVHIPEAPLDVLAQHLVAELSACDWDCDELYSVLRGAWPYRDLEREAFDAVVDMLATGYATRRGRRSAFLHHDAVNGRLRARPAARLTALQNGGAIPDQFDYDVIMQPQGFRVGTLNEDFAFESIPGDIFQLGNTSYRVLKIEQGRVLVDDAHGQPPTIPFWFGDRPGRSDELSEAVSALREEAGRRLDENGVDDLREWLIGECGHAAAGEQAAGYLAAAREALGCIPTRDRMVLERFFDDTGDLHLIIHAPLGSRVIRAWGLALRKRFCRHFNFELQAAALEDCLILSLGETHSFDKESVPDFLKAASVRQVLTQAVLDAPMFEVRWRWNATIALAVQRMRNGRKVPPQWQRNQAEDLVAVVFPDQLACLENIRGEREIPDHPLVCQTLSDCLNETMDISGLERVLAAREQGDCAIHCVDLTAPSPLAAEIINARPYAFLDDGEAENRRTRAIRQTPNDLADAGMLRIISVPAIDQVRAEAWITPRNADELHDGLLQLGFLTEAEFTQPDWSPWFRALADEFRACCVRRGNGQAWWVATERLAEVLALDPQAKPAPDPRAVWSPETEPDGPEAALRELLRSRLGGLGPVTVERLARDFGLSAAVIEQALGVLQNEGVAMQMAPDGEPAQWCERRLLARIHRYSRERRRRAARPVPPAAFLRFLLDWHGIEAPDTEVSQALERLEGWVAPLASWENQLLASRCRNYRPEALDQCFLSGQVCWFRPPQGASERQQIIAATPIGIVQRAHARLWQSGPAPSDEALGGAAAAVLALLREHGALFTPDLQDQAGLLRPELEHALAALIARGLVTADAFSPLRWLIRPENVKRRQLRSARPRSPLLAGGGMLGRWSAVPPVAEGEPATPDDHLPVVCAALLKRYGVVFRAVLERESLLPPWRDLLRYLRRMEDRGEVHGGRFVDGFSGEQFALPEAVGLLRRHAATDVDRYAVIGAADPLNLGGIITAGAKTPALNGGRILLRDGVPVARGNGDQVEVLDSRLRMTDAELRARLLTVRPLQAGNHDEKRVRP
ncbi:DEAD/DEAH box helicase [Elongatibacter sediminis]|uniref:DEAD/DEAH box helicase n=1 Tax=Elongatibacter sediminis TaxID=3119006 RepID=A0AAW9R9S7_9GAMM